MIPKKIAYSSLDKVGFRTFRGGGRGVGAGSRVINPYDQKVTKNPKLAKGGRGGAI